MRRLRRLRCRTDTEVTASGWSLFWQGMGHSLPRQVFGADHRRRAGRSLAGKQRQSREILYCVGVRAFRRSTVSAEQLLECPGPEHLCGELTRLRSVMPAHSRTVWSALALASRVPSGDQATEHTAPVWTLSGGAPRGRPLAVSQIRTVRSQPPLARRVPSGDQATDSTDSVWPFRVWSWWPLAVSQIRTVSSWLALASRVPSGDQATDATGWVWPLRVRRCRPLAAPQIPMSETPPAVARRVPSGDQATESTSPVLPSRGGRARCPGISTNRWTARARASLASGNGCGVRSSASTARPVPNRGCRRRSPEPRTLAPRRSPSALWPRFAA
jgi:hypothetical protein